MSLVLAGEISVVVDLSLDRLCQLGFVIVAVPLFHVSQEEELGLRVVQSSLVHGLLSLKECLEVYQLLV